MDFVRTDPGVSFEKTTGSRLRQIRNDWGKSPGLPEERDGRQEDTDGTHEMKEERNEPEETEEMNETLLSKR